MKIWSDKVLDDRPHPDPLPRGEGTGIVSFARCRKPSDKPSHRLFCGMTKGSPLSGERLGEGERNR
jgi:hypothetical protein